MPVRQWVLTVPHGLRAKTMVDPALTSAVLRELIRAISSWLRQRERRQGVVGALKTGAATVIQRFNSALGANPHFHTLFLDGVYTFPVGRAPVFHPTPAPTDENVACGTSRLTTMWLGPRAWATMPDSSGSIETPRRKPTTRGAGSVAPRYAGAAPSHAWEYKGIFRAREIGATQMDGNIPIGNWALYEDQNPQGQKIEIDAVLSRLGARGWELVAVEPRSTHPGTMVNGLTTDEIWVFKRPR